AGLESLVSVERLDLSVIDSARYAGQSFNGVFSNFGGLNCIPNLSRVFEAAANWLKPGSCAVFCIVGRFCPWEMMSFLVRGNIKGAFRRFNVDSTAQVGSSKFPVWYYSPGDIRKMLRPWFS